ncbi:NAD(+) diphosphatase [Acidocella sp.]|jgi:NAD+ diphosphatase|uniref:NAD(+) diphosphatase n=1 Tax=Acidocella sp. TaxID=50710 RepID=UPI002F3FB933
MQRITPSQPNAYTGGTLDRAAHRRSDEAWVQSALRDPSSRFVLFWRGHALIAAGDAPKAALVSRPELDAPWVFLGLQDQNPVFAADLSALDDPHILYGTSFAFTDMRSLTALLPTDDATILATARAMLHWRAQTKFCAHCGAPTVPVRGGYVLKCTAQGTEHFPRSDPAVIMLVTKGKRVLLGQSHKFPIERNMYSTLAGFVEPGESLEDSVRREVFEEVGVRVGAVSYHSSQPWPFPASLMLGYHAEALTEEIVLETDEMRDARWYTREELENHRDLGFNLPRHDSIARRLIEDWMAQTAPR